ncbi:MAG: OsmC family protein [Candidatus Jordarchaeales archaeon]|nr:OsmC family protein [Candidatus Jordarchaeia archaeon]
MSVEEPAVKAVIGWAGDGRLSVEFEGLPKLMVEEAKEEGFRAIHFLLTAVASCLSGSLLYCLSKAKTEPKAFSANAKLFLHRVEGRLRVKSIDVTLSPVFDGEVPKRAERCFTIFRDYCIVTESVIKGINVNVEVKPEVK